MNNIKNKICCVKWIETYIYFPTLTVILLLSILGIVSPAGFRNNNIENLKLFLVAITSSHVFSIILRIIQITQQRTIILKDNSTTIIYGAVLFSISLFIPVTWTPLAKLLDLNTINEWSLMMLSITSLFIRFTYKNEISSENYEIEKLFHHRKELSDRIKEYLIQRNYNSQPEVIGIFGTWGSGKTFFLEQLKKKLEKEKKEQMFIIYFNPLRFLDNKTAIIKFLETLKFEYEKFIDGPLFEFQDYLEIIGEKQKDWISKLLQYSPTGYQFDDLEKITLRLNQIIKTHKIQGIIIIDELDRLKDEEFISTLKIMRTISFFSGLTLVCGLDYSHAIQTIKKEFKSEANTYLQKYFDKTYMLPRNLSLELKDKLKTRIIQLNNLETISNNDLDRLNVLITEMFELNYYIKILDQTSSEHYYGEIIFKQTRGVTQFLDSFETNIDRTSKFGGDIYDLFLVEMLKLLSPELWFKMPLEKNNFSISENPDGKRYLQIQNWEKNQKPIATIYNNTQVDEQTCLNFILNKLFTGTNSMRPGRACDEETFSLYFYGTLNLTIDLDIFTDLIKNYNSQNQLISNEVENLLPMLLNPAIWNATPVDIQTKISAIFTLLADHEKKESALEVLLDSLLMKNNKKEFEDSIKWCVPKNEEKIWQNVKIGKYATTIINWFIRKYEEHQFNAEKSAQKKIILNAINQLNIRLQEPSLTRCIIKAYIQKTFIDYSEFSEISRDVIIKNRLHFVYLEMTTYRKNEIYLDSSAVECAKKNMPSSFIDNTIEEFLQIHGSEFNDVSQKIRTLLMEYNEPNGKIDFQLTSAYEIEEKLINIISEVYKSATSI